MQRYAKNENHSYDRKVGNIKFAIASEKFTKMFNTIGLFPN